MTQPNYNSEGQQVWDPSVGLHFSPGSENAESYGGIVTALQDQIVAAGGVVENPEGDLFTYNKENLLNTSFLCKGF